MLGSLAQGITEINGFLQGEDCLATIEAFRAMGVGIHGPQGGQLQIRGVGLRGLRRPAEPLDVGNSGTSMRLICGILAGQAFDSVLTGDGSLNRRPMRRVTEPLVKMGARIESTPAGTAPLSIKGGAVLEAIDYRMPMASAQVKSCVLLAGLYARGETCVTEPAPSRDHTERMLLAFGYPVSRGDGHRVCLHGGGSLRGCDIDVPADMSSAAFLMVGASIAPGSRVLLEQVGINPTRTGVLEILRLMGADIELRNQRQAGDEPVADILVRSAPLRGIRIPKALVPLAIDEFPIVFVAAACAEGETVLSGAEELRVKESDRIQVMAKGLKALGVDVKAMPDGMTIRGAGGFAGGRVDSHGDHRVAMAFTLAGLRANAAIRVGNCANVQTSFPGFAHLTQSLGLVVSEAWV
jgi:3-phosphoshikimate 1-carboxyvinyltransferase